MTLELRATPEETMRAVEAFREFARTQQIPEKTAFGLALALEECGSNIVNHALKRDAAQKFRVTFELAADEMFIELRDCGPEFDPTASTISLTETHSDEPCGGWGIQLVRHYMDKVCYKREGGENILRLGKRLTPASGAAEFQKS